MAMSSSRESCMAGCKKKSSPFRALRLIGPEFIPVSIALNGQVTIACYPLDRTLVYRKVLSARSQETQLPICCWVDRGDQKKLWLRWDSNSHEFA